MGLAVYYIEDDFNITSNSPGLQDDDSGTINRWYPWQALSRVFTSTSASSETTYTSAVYDLTSDDIVKLDDKMQWLEEAAQAGDEQTFLSIQKTIDWQKRSPQDLIYVIQLALSIGLLTTARELAAEGIQHFPNQDQIQKYARILAPPEVTRSNRPPDKSLRTNRDWLMTHGDTFSGQWVALHDGELVDSAPSLKLLAEQIGDTENLLLTKVF